MNSNGRACRLMFAVETPLGYRVFLTRDRWRRITQQKHPALAGYQKQIRACLEFPAVIRPSPQDPDVHLYYGTSAQGVLCVVVTPADENERFVVTAYFTAHIKKVNALWTSQSLARGFIYSFRDTPSLA